jgi:hypothetical protein
VGLFGRESWGGFVSARAVNLTRPATPTLAVLQSQTGLQHEKRILDTHFALTFLMLVLDALTVCLHDCTELQLPGL